MYHGDIRLGDTIDIKFTTRQISGAPSTLSSSPVISAYPGNSTTELTAGITLSVDFDSRTGLNNVRVVASGGNGYATATNYALVITTGTVNSVSVVGEVIGTFSIEARSAIMPTTAARTLLVDANGVADARLADAVSHGGTLGSSTATLAMSRVNITSQTSNTVGLTVAGNGTGAGSTITGGATGIGLSVVGGGTSGDGIKVTTTSGHGLNLAPVGTNMHGALITGGNGGTSDGLKLVNGTGGVGLRASDATVTNNLIVSGTTTLSGAVQLSSTLGITGAVTLSSTLTTGAVTLAGFTTGAIAATTITASGAVAFQSTFAVTTSTSLAALSATTITASGAVAFQSTLGVTGTTTFAAINTGTITTTGNWAVSGTVTLTGAVTANNAGNAITGVTAALTGDLTATMKTSVTTAATAATPNLNAAYDAAKTALQSGGSVNVTKINSVTIVGDGSGTPFNV